MEVLCFFLGTLAITGLLMPFFWYTARKPSVWVGTVLTIAIVWEWMLVSNICTSMPTPAWHFWIAMSLPGLISLLPLVLFRRMKAGCRVICTLGVILVSTALMLYMLWVLNFVFTTPATAPIPWWVGIWFL